AGAGIAVRPGDAAAMAAGIARLASDRHQRARMGQAGGSFVAREFSRPLWAARYLSLLSRLPAADRAGRPGASTQLRQELKVSDVFRFILPALAAAALAFGFTPLVALVAVRVGAIDIPDARKVHDRPMPRLGGLAVVTSIALVFGGAQSLSAD